MEHFKVLLTILIVGCGIVNINAAKKKKTETTAEPAYHAGVLYECKGSIKEFNLTTDNPLARQKRVKFTKDGKQKMSILDYDEAGYPAGSDASMGQKRMVVKIDYDSINQPVKFLIDTTVGTDMNVTVTQTFTNGVMTASDWYANESGRHLIHSDYTDHHFDDHGNWVTRTATNTTFTETPDGVNPETKTYTEERTILYY